MNSAYNLLALAAILLTVSATDVGVPPPWAPTDPLVTIYNTSPSEICYKIEFTTGHFPTPTTCDSSPGLKVPARQSVALHPGPGFNGALTAITNNNNVKGARHELNFTASPPGSCWYDVGYQLGMSDSTLGPADHRPRSGGKFPSVAGEQDTLAKANAAWPHAANRAALLKYPKYIQGDEGKLSHVYMDGGAPQEVAEFFQLTADFTAYLGPGSVEGVGVEKGSRKAEMDGRADEKSWVVDTQRMEIIAY